MKGFAASKDFGLLPSPIGQAAAGRDVAEKLKRTQRADGSWVNPENLVKEDDPLIATPFAIRALI